MVCHVYLDKPLYFNIETVVYTCLYRFCTAVFKCRSVYRHHAVSSHFFLMLTLFSFFLVFFLPTLLSLSVFLFVILSIFYALLLSDFEVPYAVFACFTDVLFI